MAGGEAAVIQTVIYAVLLFLDWLMGPPKWMVAIPPGLMEE